MTSTPATILTALEKNSEPGTLYWESRVAETLGLPRKMLASLRTRFLEEGLDFVRRENNAVALTAIGLSKMEGLLKNSAPAQEETAEKPAVPAGPPKREMMTVERVPANPALLLCRPKTRPVLIAIRVRENFNFAPGMTLEAMESGDGIWQFRNRPGSDESTVGRLPRGKGKW